MVKMAVPPIEKIMLIQDTSSIEKRIKNTSQWSASITQYRLNFDKCTYVLQHAISSLKMQPTVVHIEYSIPLGWHSASKTRYAIIQWIDWRNILHLAKNEQSQKTCYRDVRMKMTWLILHVPSVLKVELWKESLSATRKKLFHIDMRRSNECGVLLVHPRDYAHSNTHLKVYIIKQKTE